MAISPPRLLLGAAGLSDLQRRIDEHAWAADVWRGVRRAADARLSEPVELPPRGGAWFHAYTSPEHGAPLKTGRRLGPWQWEHRCPVSGQVYLGDPSTPLKDYDGCVIRGLHQTWSEDARSLALAWRVTGDEGYADKAREVLLAYVKVYRGYPIHNNDGDTTRGLTGGHIGSQNLCESTWLIRLLQAADLVWPALSDGHRAAILDQIVKPALDEVILVQRVGDGVHNIQCWLNSAIGLAGFLFDEASWIERAIDDPQSGFHRNLAEGVRDDGMWWEGAWSYHFYTLSSLWPLAEAARLNGVDLYTEPYRRMFAAPLELAGPTRVLPAFNDSRRVPLASQAAEFEVAAARFDDPRFAQIIAGADRGGETVLWMGADPAPGDAPEPPDQVSRNLPLSGYAVLTRGRGVGATWLCLKYGPHGGGHGHPDKLSFVLFAAGREVAVDPGTCRYGVPLHSGWYKTSLAHNTLIVDEQSQEPAEGRCLVFETSGDMDYVIADAGPIGEGVRFQRTAALLDEGLVVLIDRVRCDHPRQLDLAYHQRGVWRQRPDAAPWSAPDTPGYRYLQDAETVTADQPAVLGAVHEDTPAWVTLAGGVSTTLITATGVGDHAGDRLPTVLFRRRAAETDFVWCISVGADPASLAVAPAEADRLSIEVRRGERRWALSSSNDELSCQPL